MPDLDRDPQPTTATLENGRGHRAVVGSFGARLIELWVPDRNGALGDVVLGFGDIEDYRRQPDLYFGCTVGRVANRIAGARFELDGETWQLAANEAPNHIHGGPERAFDRRTWHEAERSANAVRYELVSPHLEEGYPGEVRASVRYELTGAGELRIDYEATVDRRTPLNLTNHSYFNLAGAGSGSVLMHVVQVVADRYALGDARLVLTGELASVEETPLDLRRPIRLERHLGALIDGPTRGYDHTLVLGDGRGSAEPVVAARVRESTSGRTMEVLTTEPTLQLYSGNRLPEVAGKRGARYGVHGGLCLETQRFPNAVNVPSFPSTIVDPGERYRSTTIYRFGAQ